MPYNPRQVPESERDMVDDWTGLAPEREKREKIPRMSENALKRGIHKLHGATQTRRNPETGEVEHLLHRGMGHEEFNKFNMGESFHNTEAKSSWTPKRDIAEDIALDQQDWYNHPFSKEKYGERKAQVVSAWVPQSDIHHIPNQLGDPSGERVGVGEHEVIVNHSRPHSIFKDTE